MSNKKPKKSITIKIHDEFAWVFHIVFAIVCLVYIIIESIKYGRISIKSEVLFWSNAILADLKLNRIAICSLYDDLSRDIKSASNHDNE